jgi:hypothetical protein
MMNRGGLAAGGISAALELRRELFPELLATLSALMISIADWGWCD